MRAVLGSMFAAVVALLGVTAAEGVTLTVEVLEFRFFNGQYNTARPESVTVEIDRATAQELRRNAEGEYVGDVTPTAQQVTIRVRTRDPLIARAVTMRLPDGKSKPAPRIRVHVIERQDVNYGYSREAVRYLYSNELDIFLALTEYALSQVGQTDSQLRVRTEYQYAIALMSACQTLNYVTCDQAATHLRNLIAMYPSRPRFFAPDNLTPESMKTTLDALLRGAGTSLASPWLADAMANRHRLAFL